MAMTVRATQIRSMAGQTENDLLYCSSATALAKISGLANAVLVTSAGKVPSLSLTLPTAVQDNITRLGTVTTGGFPAANLTGTTLASNVVTSSLTAVGTITTGTWNAGTGVFSRTTDGNTMDVVNTAAGFTAEAFTVHASRAASDAYVLANLYANNVSQFRVKGNGNVDIGTALENRPTYAGSLVFYESPASSQAVGGIEWHISASGNGYGWKIGAKAYAGPPTDPFVIAVRQSSTSWTDRLTLGYDGYALLAGRLTLAAPAQGQKLQFKRTDSTAGIGIIEVVGNDDAVEWSFGVNQLVGANAFEVNEGGATNRLKVVTGGQLAMNTATSDGMYEALVINHRANDTEAGTALVLGGDGTGRYSTRIVGYNNPFASYNTKLVLQTMNGASSYVDALTLYSTGNALFAGLINSSKLGTHTFSTADAGENQIFIDHNGTGAVDQSSFRADAGTTSGSLHVYGQNFPDNGWYGQSKTLLVAEGAGGLSIAATHASGAIRFYTGGTTKTGEFQSGGDFYTNDGTVHSLSDARTKTLQRPFQAGIEALKAVHPTLGVYRYNTDISGVDAPRSSGEFVSITAQSAQSVIPEAVKVGTDGYLTMTTTPLFYATINAVVSHDTRIAQLEAEIKTPCFETQMQSLNSLTVITQTHDQEIQSLKAKVAALESELAQMKAA